MTSVSFPVIMVSLYLEREGIQKEMRWKKVDGESVVESRKKCIVINGIG